MLIDDIGIITAAKSVIVNLLVPRFWCVLVTFGDCTSNGAWRDFRYLIISVVSTGSGVSSCLLINAPLLVHDVIFSVLSHRGTL